MSCELTPDLKRSPAYSAHAGSKRPNTNVTVGKFQKMILTACKRTAISLISLHLIHKSSVPSLP